jgi:hypothetical protein
MGRGLFCIFIEDIYYLKYSNVLFSSAKPGFSV